MSKCSKHLVELGYNLVFSVLNAKRSLTKGVTSQGKRWLDRSGLDFLMLDHKLFAFLFRCLCFKELDKIQETYYGISAVWKM